MTTRAILAYLKQRAPNYTPAVFLSILNEIHYLVMSQTTGRSTYVDPTTGMPPYIATTAGVFQYNCPTNCLRTLNIFTEEIQDYSTTRNFTGRYCEYVFKAKQYWAVPFKGTDADYDTLASVIFRDDPGTTTNIYFHEYVLKPTQITSDSIQLEVPQKHHLSLCDGVLARLQAEDYGAQTAWEFWETQKMPKIVADLNGMSGGQVGFTLDREENRYYGAGYRSQR